MTGDARSVPNSTEEVTMTPLNMIDSKGLQTILDNSTRETERFVRDMPPDTDRVASLLAAILENTHRVVSMLAVALSAGVYEANSNPPKEMPVKRKKPQGQEIGKHGSS